MKKYLTLLLFGSLVFAQNINQTDIDAQIQKIKNADASERVKLMNAFKLKVAQMNQKERINAIKAIQKKMSTEIPTEKTATIPQQRMQQIQANDNIMTYQNMNQQHLQGQVSPKNIENTMGGNFHPRILH
jgi:hypothetical protein